MAVKVKIPTPLQKLTGGKAEVSLEGSTIDEVFSNFEKMTPGIKERLYDKDGKIRRFINVYINEEDIRFLSGEDSAVKDGDEVSIIPAIAGGK